MVYLGQDYQKKRIEQNQKFLLKLLNLHLFNFYPLRKWLGISYKGKIDEVTHLSIAYDTKYFKKGKKWFKQQTRVYQQPDLAYKLNLLLDKIPQLALLPALLQPAYGLGALAFFFLTQTTYQPTTKDNYIRSYAPNDNLGSDVGINIYDHELDKSRALLEFDISDIPINVTFSQGDLQLYYYNWVINNPSGKTAWAYKLTRTDWVELEATWNIYKTGSNWTTAGGDYVTSSPSGASVNIPASYGWVTWGIQAIIEDAYTNSNNVEVLVKYESETFTEATGAGVVCFHSKEYTDDTTLRPKLTVTYTAPTAFTATLTETLTSSDTLGKTQNLSKTHTSVINLSPIFTKLTKFFINLKENDAA